MKKRGWLHRQLLNAATVVQSLPEWMRRSSDTEGDIEERRGPTNPADSSKEEAPACEKPAEHHQ